VATLRSLCMIVRVLLFKKPFWEGLQQGSITLTYRRWDKPHVRAGGRYRCHPIGVLQVDAISRVAAGTITDDDAKRSGFATAAELRGYLAELGPLDDATEVWRVELHHGGDGDRVEIALDTALTADDVVAIRDKLARMDRTKPWTKRTLALIDKQPRIAASKLAVKVGRPTLEFKADVRKLKRLGLTQSFEVGYEISPRGRAYLAAAPARSAPSSRGGKRTSPTARTRTTRSASTRGRASRGARRGRRTPASGGRAHGRRSEAAASARSDRARR